MSTITATPSGKWKFKGFLNIQLSEADQQAFDYWGEASIEDINTALGTLIAGGYKVSMSWNDWSDQYQIAATCKDPESKYYGYCIVVSHEALLQGLVVMMHLYTSELLTGKLQLAEERLPEQSELPL